MRSTRKNNQYYFSFKIHIGTDINRNAIHSAIVTSANEADVNELPKLLHKDDKVIFSQMRVILVTLTNKEHATLA